MGRRQRQLQRDRFRGPATMRYASTAILACGMFLMCPVKRIEAQSYERLQPIVLSGSPCCASPARIAPQPIMPYRGASYMSPSMSECIPPVLTASEFIPLPAGPAQPVNAEAMLPVVEYRVYAPVVPPAERETVLRPLSALRRYRPATCSAKDSWGSPSCTSRTNRCGTS